MPEFEKVYIYPLSDFHIGDPYFDEKKLRGYLKIIRDVPEAYCIFDGDLINCGLPDSVGAEDFYNQCPLTPQAQHEYLVELIKEYDIVDKIIAVIGGSNHPARAMKKIGIDYDRQFAVDMGIPERYLTPSGVIFLGIGSRKVSSATHHKGTSIWYTLFVTHGTSGGRKAGGTVNATRDIGAIFCVDCVVTAHRHLDAVTKDEVYHMDLHNKSVIKMKRMFVSAGTFLGYSKYAQSKTLQPNGTGTPRIRLSGLTKDIHVSV